MTDAALMQQDIHHDHNKFSRETWLSLGLVITLLGAAFSFGVVYMTVQQLVVTTTEVNRSLQETREEVSALRAHREADRQVLSDIKSDVNIIKQQGKTKF